MYCMSGYACHRLLAPQAVPKEGLFVEHSPIPLQLIIGLKEMRRTLAKSELQLTPLLV